MIRLLFGIFFLLFLNVRAQNCRADGWKPLDVMARFNLSQNAVLIKVISFENRRTESYGQVYDVTVTLLCKIKGNDQFPGTFLITELGDRPANCPSRNVEEGRDYIIFLKAETFGEAFQPEEVNQEICIWRTTDENFRLFAGVLNHCYKSDGCFEQDPDNWAPQTIGTRANGAEIIVLVKVKQIHYHDSNIQTSSYLAENQRQCVMKQPQEIAPLGDFFNSTGLGIRAGQCYEHKVEEEKTYVMFLQRYYALPPLIGATVPPELLENYFLSPQEVNQQQAVFNVTDDVKEELKDFLALCDDASSPRASLITFILLLILSTLLSWTF